MLQGQYGAVGVLGELLRLYISYSRWFHQPDLRIYPAELGGIHLTNMWMNGEMLYHAVPNQRGAQNGLNNGEVTPSL